MHKGLYLLHSGVLDHVYGPAERAAIEQRVNIYAPPQTLDSVKRDSSVLAEAELIFSSWGMPVMDAAFLAAAPRLRAVFYGAGSIRSFVTDAFWKRGIVITSAYEPNDVPVAEYTLAMIILSLKHTWRHIDRMKKGGTWWDRQVPVPGGYHSTVGLISLGKIARLTLALLQPFDLCVIVYSTSLTDAEAQKLNVERCSLNEVFRRADVVSLHTPSLPQTCGMITGQHFASMKTGATFINTARGAVVRESEMIAVLQQRPDLTAVLDVTDPEPPAADSPLFTMPNVVVTPHISGSMHGECRRLGHFMVEELDRYLAGQPLHGQITAETAARLA
jgi:phosphoglycerate dehydrogenase-like enzyme